MATPTKDTVFVRNVSIQAEIGLDSWGRAKPQPALISVRLSFSIEKAGVSDNIYDCMDYRKIYKALTHFDKQKFLGPVDLAQKVCVDVLKAVNGERIETTVVLPKGLLQSEGVSVEMMMSQHPIISLEMKALLVHKLVIPCVIGIGAHERPRKQPVVVDLRFEQRIMEAENLLQHLDRIFQVHLSHSLSRYNINPNTYRPSKNPTTSLLKHSSQQCLASYFANSTPVSPK
jgi:FolB domain-containing protein